MPKKILKFALLGNCFSDIFTEVEILVNSSLNMTVFFTNLAVKKKNVRENFEDIYFHNILRLFDVLPNFPFTTSETMGDCYL